MSCFRTKSGWIDRSQSLIWNYSKSLLFWPFFKIFSSWWKRWPNRGTRGSYLKPMAGASRGQGSAQKIVDWLQNGKVQFCRDLFALGFLKINHLYHFWRAPCFFNQVDISHEPTSWVQEGFQYLQIWINCIMVVWLGAADFHKCPVPARLDMCFHSLSSLVIPSGKKTW
jgi:hypothetical protein